MYRGDAAAAPIGNENRNTIRDTHGHAALPIEGNNGISLWRLLQAIARTDNRNGAPVNLADPLNDARNDGLEAREILVDPISPELELTGRECVSRER
jgi:hypothetical protein